MKHPSLRFPRPLRWLAPALVLGAVLGLAAFPVSAAGAGWLSRQTQVDVTGLVTAPSGHALGGLQVVLELIRETRDFRTLEKVRRDLTPITTTTDEAGSFRLAGPWTRYYNRMELVVGLAVQGPGEMRFQELERIDVTPRLKRGGAAVIPVVVENVAFIEDYRAFVAGLASADERRAFALRGRPDKVENLKFGARRQNAWWYFAVGQVVRFLDGTVVEVEQFDPILPIPPTPSVAPGAPLP